MKIYTSWILPAILALCLAISALSQGTGEPGSGGSGPGDMGPGPGGSGEPGSGGPGPGGSGGMGPGPGGNDGNGMNDFNNRRRIFEVSFGNNNSLSVNGTQDPTNSVNGSTDQIRCSVEFGRSESEMLGFIMDYALNSTSSDYDTAFDVSICGIVEFIESGDTDGYQSYEDTFVQLYGDNVEWGNWTEDNSSSSSNYTRYTISTDDGVVTIGFYFANSFAQINNDVSIDANEFKFDITLSNFPYQYENQSRIAVCASITSDYAVATVAQVSSTPDRFEISSTSGTTQGFFDWISATEEGYDILPTYEVSTSGVNVYFTIDTDSHPDEIVWDPSLGVEATASNDTGSDDNGNAAAGLTAGVIGLLMTITLYIM